MKIVKKDEAEVFVNSSTSELLEYSIKLAEKNIDFCINSITGRYPQTGYCSNTACQELCYVLEGSGSINKKDETIDFKQGDVVFIDKNEVYYWNGNCKLILICTPAWSKEQCVLIDE